MQRQRFDAGVRIYVSHRNFDFGDLAQSRNQLSSEQRVPAKVEEEILVDADLIALEHLLPDRCDAVLHLGPREHEMAFVTDQWRARLRELLAVDLAADEARHLFQHFEECRHHVWRQFRAQPCKDGTAHQRLRTVPQLDIGHERVTPIGAVQLGNRNRDVRLLEQQRIDFRQLDPVAADLDLIVGAPEKFDLTVIVDAGDVARAIVTRVVTRLGDVVALGQVGAIEIAARHAYAADVEFALRALGQRIEVLVKDMNLVSAQRLANCHGTPGPADERGRVDRRLGRPVDVEHQPLRSRPDLYEFRLAWLAADNDLAQHRQLRRLHGRQHGRYG